MVCERHIYPISVQRSRKELVCGRKSERYRRCQCPIYIEGSLAGESIRKSLDLTSWEAASDLVAQWNAAGQIGGTRVEIPSIVDAVGKHIRDAEARNLQPASLKKIRDILRRRFLRKLPGYVDSRFGDSPTS